MRRLGFLNVVRNSGCGETGLVDEFAAIIPYAVLAVLAVPPAGEGMTWGTVFPLKFR